VKKTLTKKMKIPIIRLFLIALPCCLAGRATAATPARPNILFVIADQWRAQALGYAGDPNVQTPHLDALQKESIDCVNAVSGVPVCCPARASLLTGQRPLTHGIFLNDLLLDPHAVTLAKVFGKAGYDTGYIGKWHLDGNGRQEFTPPERRQGFVYWKAMNCTHRYNDSFYFADGPEKLKWEGFDAIAQAKDAQQYLRDHAKADKPFLLFLAWGPPHGPYQNAPAEYKAKYQEDKLHLRPNVAKEAEARARHDLAGYYASCTALDDCVGDLMRTLRETGLAENTIVVFTADHGDMLGSQGQYTKQRPYDESIRVPLLLRWPAGFGPQGRKLDTPINSEDFMPTLLGLCALPIPSTVEGLDFSGYLRGGKNPSDGAALISCPSPFGQFERKDGGREFRGVRTKRYTYVRDLKGPWLLYDNREDPYQMHNLVNEPSAGKLQAELDATLTRKLQASGDKFLPGDEYIKARGYTVNKNGTVVYHN